MVNSYVLAATCCSLTLPLFLPLIMPGDPQPDPGACAAEC